FVFEPEQYQAFLRDRRGAAVGRQLADLYGFKVGDAIPLKSGIYPGNWEFNVRAIYDARDETTITRQMYFHYDYLNEQVKRLTPRRGDFAGVFVVGINEGQAAPNISRVIDAEFKNSLAETLTETEKAFTLGFVAMVETIVVAIEGVSYVVILIIMAVAANTMAMTARERLSEYATLKALGFKPGAVAAMIIGEAFLLAALGAGLGMLLTPVVVQAFHAVTVSVFAKMPLVAQTFYLQAACAVAVGLVAGIVPAVRAARVKIVDGLRHIG
ncbi:MAG TPA: FtsX-like permease family protein, partial [Burkholderiaceae bacterium]|nr:FtsX-like permease family protein [Burkholderiaceae bacterium]